ncbi:zinc finger and SCAN domain-containing protein 2-like [Archocentrus centrarchus]|uniref:zinc finger and SCAN domain-containing protein 2-like n=1 Tax=Archocentrus centrarchus TaxID=63155 RepID=UPI0011EA3BC5|nr:zinc finger and SCAN domain-containing protein 2-like [Archocentrus centrarchus]
MPSVQYLREFINERLTAAAEEIFTEFEKTIVQYEEEIDRQRRLLDITWKPEIKLLRTDLPQQYDCKEEEVLTEEQLWNQERISSLNPEEPEPPQIKEELCSSQEGEQLVLKEETDIFMVTGAYEESDHSEAEPDREQLLSHSSNTVMFEQHVSKEEEDVLTEQQLWNQERSSSHDPEEPEPPQIKEDQEELSSSQQGEQLVLKEETDTFMVTAVYEESDHSEAEPDREQLFPHSTAVAESQDQEGSYNVVLGSTRNAESDPNKHHRNQSHSNNLEDSSMSESQHNTDAGKNSVKCDICGKLFKKKSIMKEHHRIHTGEKPYTCETCGKSFGKNSNLLTHMKTHTGEKPYSCKTCGKCFTVRSNLLAHIRVHTGEKPFLCKTCGKRFSDSSALKRHKVVHTGEKPYSCQTCGKSLTESSSLLVHMRIHTGEKPYHCKTCGKMFRQRNHLLAHMKTHRGQRS